jgi:hypothetical protein
MGGAWPQVKLPPISRSVFLVTRGVWHSGNKPSTAFLKSRKTVACGFRWLLKKSFEATISPVAAVYDRRYSVDSRKDRRS